MSHEAYKSYILRKKCKIAKRAMILEKNAIKRLSFLKMIKEVRAYHNYLTNEIKKLRRH